jgi:DNA-3-methyladenine glycosylase
MTALSQSFYERPTATVAEELLGKMIVRVLPDSSRLSMIITETEAYLGEMDLASHARFGQTKRNVVMYGHPGIWYVYLIYGIHEMLNVTTESHGTPGAVLIRAGMFEAGAFANGPGVVTRQLEVGREFYGESAVGNKSLFIRDGGLVVPKEAIAAGPRIGVNYAKEWKDQPLRFVLDKSYLLKMNK